MQARKEKLLVAIFDQFIEQHEAKTGARVFRFENLTDWLSTDHANLNFKQITWMMERDEIEDLGNRQYFYNKKEEV